MTRTTAYRPHRRLPHAQARTATPDRRSAALAGALVILAAALLWAGMAHAKPPLREVEEIDSELYYIAIANEIDKRCDAISGRRFKAINVMWGLKRKANDLGYSDAEIRAYVDSDAEKARMRRKGEAYLSANGVGDRKPESFCALGRAEIKRNSAIGVYLRAK